MACAYERVDAMAADTTYGDPDGVAARRKVAG